MPGASRASTTAHAQGPGWGWGPAKRRGGNRKGPNQGHRQPHTGEASGGRKRAHARASVPAPTRPHAQRRTKAFA
eukprot:1555815-Alexandrium_andersonii.AAC.1